MKSLRIIGNILIGIILFGLIFSFTFIKTTQSFIEKDLVVSAVKISLTEALDKEQNGDKTEREKVIKDIFEDSETGDLVNLVIDNYREYRKNKDSFKVSDTDVEKIYSYVMKHKEEIKRITSKNGKDITDDELKEIFNSASINEYANKVFKEITNDVGDGIDEAVEIYNNVVSNSLTWLFILLIIFFILLLGLINWSLYKWMLPTGISLIISGFLISLIFISGQFLIDIFSFDKVIQEIIGNINFNGFIIVGASEIIIGIIMVIIYSKLKNKPLDEKINNLGVDE